MSRKKLFLLGFLTLFFACVFYLIVIHLPNYLRVKELSNWGVTNALTLENQLKDYYRYHLSLPENKKELDEFLLLNSPDYLVRNLSEVNYRVINKGSQLTIYDLGFNNKDDSLKQTCVNKNFLASMFFDCDFLIYQNEFEHPKKLLIGDYFVYDSNGIMIEHDKRYKSKIESYRSKFLDYYYKKKHNLSYKDVRFNPGQSPDTILIQGTYDHLNGNWNTTVAGFIPLDESIELNAFDSLFSELKFIDDRIDQSYVTVYIASKESQIDHSTILP
mgnify:FL=1